MDPQQKAVADEFNQYGGTYSEAVNSALAFSGLKVDFFTRVKADYLVDILAGHSGETSNLSILDIGCGVGNYHALVRKRVRSLTGIDVSERCIEKARADHPDVRYDTYDGQRLPYAEGTFDAAFTVCVMHHVPPAQWDAFASEMYRVLRPGGIAVVFEHNPANPLTMRVVNRCAFDRDAVLLDAKNTASRFEQCGFAPVQRRFILAVPATNFILRQVDKFFSRLPFGAQYYVSAVKAGER